MLNVCFASDDNYAPYLSIALVSLLENNLGDFDEIQVFILDNGIKKTNKDKINNISDNLKIIFVPIENIEEKFDITLSKMVVKGDFSLANYSRLFVASLLPNTVDKLLYLDCDGLILGSFKEIWDLDLSNYLAAGVLALNCPNDIKKLNGLSRDDYYINSGMLLINLKRWREENIEIRLLNKLIEFSEDNRHMGMDQGVINSVLTKDLLILDPQYNLEGSLHNTSYDITFKLNENIQEGYYSKEVLDNAIKNPVFQHFCVGPGDFYHRPWLNKYHENNKLYRKYFDLVDFDFDEVFHYQDVTFIKRFNRFLARNKLTSFLICKLIPDKLAKRIVNNKIVVEDFQDVERW